MSLDRIRLARLLGMLGSDHDGEVANAGRLAAQLVKKARVSWIELIEPDDEAGHQLVVATAAAQRLLDENERLRAEVMHLRARTPAMPASWTAPTTIEQAIDTAIAWSAFLSDWEREFTNSLAGRRGSLTPKQRERLRELTQKIARIARAHGRAT